MVKYDALPDIDTQPDVYETPDGGLASPTADDYDDLSESSIEEEEESEEIVRTSLSVAAAATRFAKANADTSTVDFSGRVGKRKRPAQKNGRRRLPDRDEYVILPRDAAGSEGEVETPFQKLRRLMFEVQELAEEVGHVDAAPTEEPAAAVTEGQAEGKQEPLPEATGQEGQAEGQTDGQAGENAVEGESKEEAKVDGSESGQGKEPEAKEAEVASASVTVPAGTVTEGAVPASPVDLTSKKSVLSQRQLLEQVSALQSELSRIAGSVNGSDPLADAIEGGGTLTKQLEVGKTLMAQLKAFKALSISDDAPPSFSGRPDSSSAQGFTNPYVTYELFYTPDSAKQTQLSKITDLESRLTSLERLLGTSHLQSLDSEDAASSILQTSGSLIGALERLDHHLALLTQPRTLDAVSRRVKSLTTELDRLADLRKKQQFDSSLSGDLLRPTGASGAGATGTDLDLHISSHQSETDRKITRLFFALERLDPIAGVIPHLLARLQGLRSLHAEAAVFSESLKMLVREQERVGESGKVVEDALKTLEASVRENEVAVQKNVQGLEERMKALMERVDKLTINGNK
ncbi:hypothetical protein HK104_008562 [Borealophlyctis nickersoniae]|nr:hypothetical protein HK104_008562 [Borealophlyctis nickersoniae]